MGVGTHNHVCALLDQPPGHFFLLGVVGEGIFNPPVWAYQNDIGVFPGAGHNGRQGGFVHPLHLGPAGRSSLVGAIGEVHDGQLEAFHINEDGVEEGVGSLVGGYAGVAESPEFHLLNGAAEACGTLVQNVVITQQKHAKSNLGQVLGEGFRTGEDRITGVRLAAQGEFHIADGQIGPLDVLFYVFEEAAIAILGRTFHNPAVAQDVSHQKNADGIRLRGRSLPELHGETDALGCPRQRKQEPQGQRKNMPDKVFHRATKIRNLQIYFK